MAEDIIRSVAPSKEPGGSTQKDLNSMGIVLQRLDEEFINEYKQIEVVIFDEKRTCFIMKNGVVFEFVGILPFDCITVSYANNIDEAKKDIFEEGDQFDAWQNFDDLVREIREELEIEEQS